MGTESITPSKTQRGNFLSGQVGHPCDIIGCVYSGLLYFLGLPQRIKVVLSALSASKKKLWCKKCKFHLCSQLRPSKARTEYVCKFNVIFHFLQFLQVLSATVNGLLNCSCNHLTSFGGSLLLQPNPIDFDKVFVEFTKLGETGNVSVIVFMSLVFITYFVVIIIVRREDIKDAARMVSFPVLLFFSFLLFSISIHSC